MGLNATGTVAQIQYPSDSIGAPYTQAFGGCVSDWPRQRAYLYNSVGVRSYDISTFQTISPLLSVALPHSGVQAGNCICTPDGYILICATGDNIAPIRAMWRKLNPATLTTVASWGPGSSYPSGMSQPVNSPGATIAVCECNGVPYAIAHESTFVNGSVFRTDLMQGAGWNGAIVSNGFHTALMCNGKSSAEEGTIFIADCQSVLGPTTSIDVQKLSILNGAETWSLSDWPTVNPYISISTIRSLAVGDVNTLLGTSWTQFTIQSMGYDSQDDVVVLMLCTSPNTNPSYFVGMSSDGDLLWSILAPANTAPSLWLSDISEGQFLAIGNGNPSGYGLINVLDGTQYPYAYLNVNGLGNIYRAYFSSAASKFAIGNVSFASAPGAVIAAPGTPSSFAGWALIQAWPIPMESISITGAVGDLGTLVQEPPNETMNRLACIQQPIPGDTMVTLQWSDDAGASWSNGIEQSLGQLGEYLTTIQFRRLGMARNRIFRVYWSGPMAEALTGMMLQYEVAQT